jgi:hypothetical protein
VVAPSRNARAISAGAAATAFNLPFDKVAKKFAGRPFGEMTLAWQQFLRELREGDELWLFSSPENTFAMKLGCQGYAIVRGGVILHTLVTLRT